jgi:hypothetical protein
MVPCPALPSPVQQEFRSNYTTDNISHTQNNPRLSYKRNLISPRRIKNKVLALALQHLGLFKYGFIAEMVELNPWFKLGVITEKCPLNINSVKGG